MSKQWKIVIAALVGLLLTSLIWVIRLSPTIQAQGNDPTTIGCSVFSSGQANGTSSSMTLQGTLGQWVAVNATNGSGQLSSGFWPTALEGCGGQPIELVFLPIFSKPPHLSYVLITNKTEGNLIYQIFLSGGHINCQVPKNTFQYPCGNPFTPGIYHWKVTAICGSKERTKEGNKTYIVGNNLIDFFCE
jgi:hypothetical protein